ncbi:hypothetical protein PUN28_000753 [Cardiocondyla obscurior]|uniref:Uncharacterized protein n=1 Tax=Cardiocondyla obscurior TaxID=286306 RepID=A0AAW2H1B7_9HYME
MSRYHNYLELTLNKIIRVGANYLSIDDVPIDASLSRSATLAIPIALSITLVPRESPRLVTHVFTRIARRTSQFVRDACHFQMQERVYILLSIIAAAVVSDTPETTAINVREINFPSESNCYLLNFYEAEKYSD